MIKQCRDCFRTVEIEKDIKLCICRCGGLIYDRDEEVVNNTLTKMRTNTGFNKSIS